MQLQKSDTSGQLTPEARAEVQRILDSAARRLLAERQAEAAKQNPERRDREAER
jgi:hypothetical protein